MSTVNFSTKRIHSFPPEYLYRIKHRTLSGASGFHGGARSRRMNTREDSAEELFGQYRSGTVRGATAVPRQQWRNRKNCRGGWKAAQLGTKLGKIENPDTGSPRLSADPGDKGATFADIRMSRTFSPVPPPEILF